MYKDLVNQVVAARNRNQPSASLGLGSGQRTCQLVEDVHCQFGLAQVVAELDDVRHAAEVLQEAQGSPERMAGEIVDARAPVVERLLGDVVQHLIDVPLDEAVAPRPVRLRKLRFGTSAAKYVSPAGRTSYAVTGRGPHRAPAMTAFWPD